MLAFHAATLSLAVGCQAVDGEAEGCNATRACGASLDCNLETGRCEPARSTESPTQEAGVAFEPVADGGDVGEPSRTSDAAAAEEVPPLVVIGPGEDGGALAPVPPDDAGAAPVPLEDASSVEAGAEPEPESVPQVDSNPGDGGPIDAGPGLPLDGGSVFDAGEPVEAGSSELPPCNAGAFSNPELISTLEVEGEAWAPALTGDGLTLYFALASGDTDERIHRAERRNRESAFGPAEEVVELSLEPVQGFPHVSLDGLRFYFSVDDGDRDLHVAELDPDTLAWFDPTVWNLNSATDDILPWESPDGLTLYYTSSRMGGEGQADLWRVTRSSLEEDFADRVAVSAVNTSAPEQSANLSPDGLTLYFTSARGAMNSRFQVYAATRVDVADDFRSNAEIVTELSESGDSDHIALSRDGREMVLSSDRDGARSLWLARRDCE